MHILQIVFPKETSHDAFTHMGEELLKISFNEEVTITHSTHTYDNCPDKLHVKRTDYTFRAKLWYVKFAIFEVENFVLKYARNVTKFIETCKNYGVHSLPGDGSLVPLINNGGRRIRILESQLESVAERNTEKSVFEGTYDHVPVMVKRVPIQKEGFNEMINTHRLLEHENIVRVYAVESDKRYRYIAFEKCSCTLEDYLASNKISKPVLLTLLRYNYKLSYFMFACFLMFL